MSITLDDVVSWADVHLLVEEAPAMSSTSRDDHTRVTSDTMEKIEAAMNGVAVTYAVAKAA